MNKVLIGIVGKPDNTENIWSYIEINNEIRECITKNNGLAIGILPQDSKFKRENANEYILDIDEINDLEQIISRVDGVILQGGLVSNTYEQEIIKICLKKDLPLLCICGGFNNMVKALGGILKEDEVDLHNQYGKNKVHGVILKSNSKLCNIIGNEKIIVNSIHKKIATIDSIKNCNVVGICPNDNTVEAIEVPNKKFAIGIKWHLELMNNEKCMNDIFKEFINSCK